ncbi:MAG: hypothetical protein WDN30_14380 [Pararobbsia sp.]
MSIAMIVSALVDTTCKIRPYEARRDGLMTSMLSPVRACSSASFDVSTEEFLELIGGRGGRIGFDHLQASPLRGELATFARDERLVVKRIERIDRLAIGHASLGGDLCG